jgi:hypothetical protein
LSHKRTYILNIIMEINEAQIINRAEILDNTKRESELSDLKQHADKMIREFEKFNNHSSNRAIWELVQNACDLTTNCEVVLDYRNNGFSFTHNGKPFTTRSFVSLIKQVSGKYDDHPDIPEVGKYGTGFLTTHTFGRKFSLNSILEADGIFFEIKDFEIDRTPKEWKALSENIRIQKEKIYELIQQAVVISKPQTITTFKFFPETAQELSYIAESSKDLEHYIPIVLSINDRLKKVTIISDKTQIYFERILKEPVSNEKEIDLYKTVISKNGDNYVLYSIADRNDQIEVVLPINEKHELFQFSERVARLFLYYPLIGSEDFGLNFVINCNQFLPTEPRDGVHLKSNKDQVKEQEESNQKIIEKASQLIFNFLKSNVIKVSNPLLYAQINFKRNTENNLLNEYFEKLQKVWMEEYKSLPIVETAEGFKAVNEVYFFSEALLNNEEYSSNIYKLVEVFYKNIPIREKVGLWSKFASEWTNENIKFIGDQDLIREISKENLFRFDKECLISYYKKLIEEEKIIYFSDNALLPNLDGEFCSLSSLLTPRNLNSPLIEIGKSLIPHIIARIIHKDFCFDFHLENFNRKDFSNAVKAKLDEMQASTYIYPPFDSTDDYIPQYTDKKKILEPSFLVSLLNYCKLSHSSSSQSKPSLLVRLISKYYSLDENLIQLPNVEISEDNLDTRSARKVLVQIFFNLIQYHTEEWVKSNINFLLDVAHYNDDSYKEVYSTSKIYPNQLNQLRSNNELKRDIDIIPEIRNLYNKVTRDEIRKDLIYKEFNEFVAEDRYVTSKFLANQIEDIFFNTDIHNINENPFKDDILKIISSLRDKKNAELFPRLDDKKANLMLEVVTNENTKEEIFSIVTLKESELKKLGLLVQEDNFSAILNIAANLMQDEKEKKADFHHKHEIGTYIESLIRRRLSNELQARISFGDNQNIEATDMQGGQDIVVFLDGIPVYFIEVKSRWNSQNSISMSKLQLQRAVEETQRYSLCAVDITRYTGTNDRYKLSTDEILPLTKFISNIGGIIKPLIEDNLEAEKTQNTSIHLIDYRGIVPQDIIQNGNDFDTFIVLLSDVIFKTAGQQKL